MKKNIINISAIIVILGFLFASCKKDEKETTTPIASTTDLTPPVLAVVGNLPIQHTLNAASVPPTVTATDNVDGDITSRIIMSGTVNKDLVGDYTLTYSVSDAVGNSDTKTVTVHVVNSAANIAGIYSVNETFNATGTPDNFTYMQTITTSTTENNKIIFSNFGNYMNGVVYATISGTTLTIPQQNVVCGTNPAPTRTFVGQGTVSGTTINYTYTETTNGTSGTGSATLVKQ
ncbi:MAG: immunoglobulin-like domain-containing protein [Bacteroidota bacterium]